MKNEIGRKLTSLTIMAVMFAGGMTIAAPSFMPGATASFAITEGMLTVSSEYIQGGAVLEIVVNDPNYADTDDDINDGPEVTISGTDYITSQGVNGKWYLYVVDQSVSKALDDDTTGFEYGHHCDTGLAISASATDLITPSGASGGYDVWAAAIGIADETATKAGSCLDIDNALRTSDDASTTINRQDILASVLQDPPTLSNHNDQTSGSATIDLGQRGHGLNASGYGSWPYILSIELASDNIIEYGDDIINVEFGNTDDETVLEIVNVNPAHSTNIHLLVTDPALNIDPTTADVWEFDLSASDATPGVHFNNNGTTASPNTAMTAAQLGSMDCVDNCRLASDIQTQISNSDTVVMTESATNSGVFESFDTNGDSEIITTLQATGDTKTVFSYGGDSLDTIITFHDATLDVDTGAGDWLPATTATVTLVDPDMNKNPGSDETLTIGDETDIIPTIVMGSPKSITDSGNNPNMCSGCATSTSGVVVGDDDSGAANYTLNIYNTTDDSKRLRIIHATEKGSMDTATETWINVTTGVTRAQLVNLPGQVVLNYDVSGPADLVSSTAIRVFLSDDGDNATDNNAGSIDLVTAGNKKAGVVSLDADTTTFLRDRDVGVSTWSGPSHAGTNFVTLAFEITHAASSDMSSTADYAIAADFCNFDQANGSDIHNCVYRLEAEETGDNTGVFEGTIEYINLNNSTSDGSLGGEHDGNDANVAGLLTDVKGDELIVVLMDGTDGSDALKVMYNDTDSIQAAENLAVSLDTFTFTGTAELDADEYEADDIATITVIDPDLNQDSSIRDTYQNSSRTFQVTVTGSDGTSQKPFSNNPMTLIETTPTSGVFVATFTVPDFNGQDIELTYYESKDSAGTSVELYDTATVTSNSGSVAFDRSVYPVPFATGELHGGDDSQDLTTSGNVTVTVTVTDADFTGDTLTTGATSAAGTINIMLIEGTTTSTCFTAGSIVADDQTSSSTIINELGPLSSVTDSGATSEYEIEFTLDKVEHCGENGMKTVSSGDVIQVKYQDASDDSGSSVSTYDSSTFDLRTGSLSVDKDVYVLGSDMVITLTDPDLNLDSGSIESYGMDLIEWDSDADSSEFMNDTDNFLNNPSSIQETGDDTGVFQTVVTLPTTGIYNGGDSTTTIQTIDFGEAVTLTYADQGLSGENNVGDDSYDVEAYFSISNFGALVELDQAVYSWTDVVYFTITAPDHNRNTASEEQIGTQALPIQVTTRSGKLCSAGTKTYLAGESGPDTGVFEGEVQLTGFAHTMSSDTADRTVTGTACGSADDDGTLTTASQTDGISVSYEYNDGSVVVASASIVWGIGEAAFDSSAVSAGGSAVVTVVDQDENLDDDVIDTFTVDVFSDSDNGGFQLTMNETNEDTGVFEGTVYFTADQASSGDMLRVSEGDTVTAEYVDETLPEPYTTDDDLTIAATTTVGTAFPPLERAPAANARVVDAFGASVAEVSVDQQVQIAADVSNGQSKDQAFAYLVQVQDGNGVTVSLAWITGSLTGGQSMSPALSWTPSDSGSYTATVFVWESVDNPTALSPTVSVDIDVV